MLVYFVGFLGLPENTKNKPGGLYFSKPFLRGLFLEGLKFGGAYLRRAICVSKLIGLALQLEVLGGAYFRNFTVSFKHLLGKQRWNDK